MSLQRKIVQEFKQCYGDLSIKSISELTGINQTRIFRIFNGMSMRVDEFEIIYTCICYRKGKKHEFISLFKQCVEKLPEKDIDEIEKIMQRKISYAGLSSKTFKGVI